MRRLSGKIEVEVVDNRICPVKNDGSKCDYGKIDGEACDVNCKWAKTVVVLEKSTDRLGSELDEFIGSVKKLGGNDGREKS